jgi:hypothetical protein
MPGGVGAKSVLGLAYVGDPQNQCDSKRNHEPVHRGPLHERVVGTHMLLYVNADSLPFLQSDQVRLR